MTLGPNRRSATADPYQQFGVCTQLCPRCRAVERLQYLYCLHQGRRVTSFFSNDRSALRARCGACLVAVLLNVQLEASSDKQRAHGSMLSRQAVNGAWVAGEFCQHENAAAGLSFRSVVLSASHARAIGTGQAVLSGF